MSDQGEKTEAATPRRRQKAREQGQVAKSTELVSAVLLFGMFLLLFNRNHGLAAQFSEYFTATAGKAHVTDVSRESIPILVRDNVFGFLRIMAPLPAGQPAAGACCREVVHLPRLAVGLDLGDARELRHVAALIPQKGLGLFGEFRKR